MLAGGPPSAVEPVPALAAVSFAYGFQDHCFLSQEGRTINSARARLAPAEMVAVQPLLPPALARISARSFASAAMDLTLAPPIEPLGQISDQLAAAQRIDPRSGTLPCVDKADGGLLGTCRGSTCRLGDEGR